MVPQESSAALLHSANHGGSEAGVRDYWTLLKPNVMQLAVFTGAAGVYLAPGRLHPILAVTTVLCMAVGAGACGAINNWYDADIDKRMGRTQYRPTAAGRVAPAEALSFGVTLSILSVMLLGLSTNWLAALILALTIVFYVVVYTMWLKRRTCQNIVIGGAAGALPPVIGWVAVTGSLDWAPIIMFAIIFLWTPPHFWALALSRTDDYRRVGVPMLPIVVGRRATEKAMVSYTVAVCLAAMALAPIAGLGWLYCLAALITSAYFLLLMVRVLVDDSDAVAMSAFRFSIVYLFALFFAMILDRALGVAPVSVMIT